MFITQFCNGTPAGVTTSPERNSLDQKHSAIWAGSTFIQFDESGNRIETSKQTDDKIVLGYTYDGLPFQIIVDGFFGGETQKTFKFIDDYVTTSIDQYAKDLSNVSKNVDEVTKDFIQDIRDKKPQACEFTMSIAVTYERDGKLQCSGFGVGDTAIAIKRETGEIDQLTTNNIVNDLKDAFDHYSASLSIDELLERNSIFTTLVSEGDELVGYTWLPDSLLKEKKAYDVNDKKENKIHVSKMELNIEALQHQGTLFDDLLEANSIAQQMRINGKQNGGDDATFGQIIIPHPELRIELQNPNPNLALLAANIRAIENQDLKDKATEVYTAAMELIRKGKDLDSVNSNLILTNQLLTSTPGEKRNELANQYFEAAKQANGANSTAGKALGLAMMVLGAAVAACGIVICTGTLGLGTTVGAISIGAGVAVYLGGLGIFYKSRQNEGLSKAMRELQAQSIDDPNPML